MRLSALALTKVLMVTLRTTFSANKHRALGRLRLFPATEEYLLGNWQEPKGSRLD